MDADTPRRPRSTAYLHPAPAPAVLSVEDARRAFLIAAVNLHGALARGLRGEAPHPLICDALADITDVLQHWAEPHGRPAQAVRLARTLAEEPGA